MIDFEAHIPLVASVLQTLCHINDATQPSATFCSTSTPCHSIPTSPNSLQTSSPLSQRSESSKIWTQPSEVSSCSSSTYTPISPHNGFKATVRPTISIRDYLNRIHRYGVCSDSVFILALIYIDRLIQKDFVAMTSLTIHRLLIVAVCIAAKFFDDVHFSNIHYSKVGGVGLEEFNLLERQMLLALNFSLYVQPTTFYQYFHQLVGASCNPVVKPESLVTNATRARNSDRAHSEFLDECPSDASSAPVTKQVICNETNQVIENVSNTSSPPPLASTSNSKSKMEPKPGNSKTRRRRKPKPKQHKPDTEMPDPDMPNTAGAQPYRELPNNASRERNDRMHWHHHKTSQKRNPRSDVRPEQTSQAKQREPKFDPNAEPRRNRRRHTHTCQKLRS